jgi:hypothetical protein
VYFEGIASWPDELRVVTLSFLASLQIAGFVADRNRAPCSSFFEAMLGLLVVNSDLGAYERANRAVLEAAVLAHSDALEGACDRVAKRLRDLGVKVTIGELKKQARHIQKAFSTAATEVPERGVAVVSVLPDAPVSPEAVVPAGWSINESGVYRGEDLVPSISCPIVIKGRCIDLDSGMEALEVAWYQEGTWHAKVVDRTKIADARYIVGELAGFGAPVNSNNSKSVVQFLMDFEQSNRAHLRRQKVTHRFGWQGNDGVDGFMWGRNLLVANDARDDAVIFQGRDDGDEQLAAGLHENGSFEKWREVIAVTQEFPKVKLALYASFVPALSPILGQQNFTLDFAGPTTGGKTTTLQLAACAWGNPDERSPAAILRTWDCTAAWRERAQAVQNNLPIFLDDTKRARDPLEISKTIYEVSQGLGRGRGSIKGIAEQASWNTVLISSGEQPATSFTGDGGARARVLTIWGSPFGQNSPTIGTMARRLRQGVLQNYGHAGPRFVKYLLRHRSKWADWKAQHVRLVEFFQDKAESNIYLARMADIFAGISMAARLAHAALGLPWKYENPLRTLWQELGREAGESNRAKAALQFVVDWATANQHAFWLRGDHQRPPSCGWAGKWGRDDWPWIGFFPGRLKELLTNGDFDCDATVRVWHDEGWLEVTKQGRAAQRRQIRTRIGTEQPWLIAIRRKAIEEVLGQPAGETENAEHGTETRVKLAKLA